MKVFLFILFAAALLVFGWILKQRELKALRKRACEKCLDIHLRLKKAADSHADYGDYFALDYCLEFYSIVQLYKLTPEEVGVQNFKLIASNAHTVYTRRVQEFLNSEIQKAAQEAADRFYKQFVEDDNSPKLVELTAYGKYNQAQG